MLSSFTVLYESYALVCTITLRNINGTFSDVLLFFDPTAIAFSTEGILYALVAGLLCFILAIVPAFLLCLYPTRCYEKVAKCCSPRKQIAVKIFVEALHSCFKNGLNGTRDYRILAGVAFVPAAWYGALELLMRRMPSHVHVHMHVNILLFFLAFFLSFLLSYIRPCKSLVMNLSLSFHTLLIGILLVIHQL